MRAHGTARAFAALHAATVLAAARGVAAHVTRHLRVSAHLGNADLTFCNEKRQICLAVPIARESVHAVRAELKQYTQRLTAGVLLHVRSQNSKVHKNGRYRKSEKGGVE